MDVVASASCRKCVCIWCSDPDSNRDDFRRQIFLPLQLSLPLQFCGLDYTFIIALLRQMFAVQSLHLQSDFSLSLARYQHFKAFTEFDEFYSQHFHQGTQILLSSLLCLPIPPSEQLIFSFSHSFRPQQQGLLLLTLA